MTRSAPQPLSVRAQRVLTTIHVHGPLDADSPRLRDAARSEGGPAVTLVALRRRFLVRWDAGGRRIRTTDAGRRLLSAEHYRSRSI
jgi:hypothetical protein